MADPHQLSNFIWQIADLLRGPYRPPQYERVMLPLTVLRRFDCVLEATKPRVLAEYAKRKDNANFKDEALDQFLNRVAGQRFHNHSALDFAKLKDDPQNISQHLVSYIQSFSKNVREIFERFEFIAEIEKMNEANVLYLVVSKFCDIDLHPDVVDNIGMGLLFEDLIRRFNEAANETAGDHFTPREVIQLMVDLLFTPDGDILTTPSKIVKLLDPTCGTGGMLSEAQKHLWEMHAQARLYVYGQDFNPRSYAIAASDLLMKGNPDDQSQRQSTIKFGDTLINDQFPDEKFDYLLANPPFGVDWKKQQKQVTDEHHRHGLNGRFGAGLPRVNDGALLFLQNMMSKFQPYEPGTNNNGSRLAIVFNGSPLFTGGAGSGESEIRKWVIENDRLDAIIALPEQMFYNTGIGTYIWIVTNRKEEHRRNRIQLIDARARWQPMRRSLGDKRRFIGEDDIRTVVQEYGQFRETPTSKIFRNIDFGYNRVAVERPLRLLYHLDVERKDRFITAFPHLADDVQAIDRTLKYDDKLGWTEFDRLLIELLKRRSNRWKAQELKEFRKIFFDPTTDTSVRPVVVEIRKAVSGPWNRVWGWFYSKPGFEERYEPNTELRDFENVNLKNDATDEEAVAKHVKDNVFPHVEDEKTWADQSSIRRAYEINFNRYFYRYKPPRSLNEIDADIKALEEDITRLLREVTE